MPSFREDLDAAHEAAKRKQAVPDPPARVIATNGAQGQPVPLRDALDQAREAKETAGSFTPRGSEPVPPRPKPEGFTPRATHEPPPEYRGG